MRVLRATGLVRAAPDRVFAVLEDPKLGDSLLPPFLRLAVVSSPWMPRPGDRTRLEASYRGSSFAIETELAEYRRGSFLLERQTGDRGPFVSLEHAIHVEREVAPADPADGTPDEAISRVTEILAYDVSLGILGRLFDRLVLHRDLETALETRLTRLRALLERG